MPTAPSLRSRALLGSRNARDSLSFLDVPCPPCLPCVPKMQRSTNVKKKQEMGWGWCLAPLGHCSHFGFSCFTSISIPETEAKEDENDKQAQEWPWLPNALSSVFSPLSIVLTFASPSLAVRYILATLALASSPCLITSLMGRIGRRIGGIVLPVFR
jgi:hypothetical protein